MEDQYAMYRVIYECGTYRDVEAAGVPHAWALATVKGKHADHSRKIVSIINLDHAAYCERGALMGSEELKGLLDLYLEIEAQHKAFVEENRPDYDADPVCGYDYWDEAMADFAYDKAGLLDRIVPLLMQRSET